MEPASCGWFGHQLSSGSPAGRSGPIPARTSSSTAVIRPSHETDVKIDLDLAGVPASSSLQVVKLKGDD